MPGLVLFGAGASHGSDTCGTPPLGTGLFDALTRFSPDTWGRISQGDAAELGFDRDFEQAMKAFAESSSDRVDVLQRAMAAFFFGFQPRESSLYVRLARWIQRIGWKGALASLNYDRLLELGVRSVGIDLVVGNASDGATELCLPHGCCNLFGQLRATGTMTFAPQIVFDSPGVRCIDDVGQYQRELEENVVPPVMSYFQPDKSTRAGLSFIRQQRKRFSDLVCSASLVVLVGLRVRAHDAHIWSPLAHTPGRLIYCAGERAAAEFETWARSCGRRDDYALRSRWDESFEEICLLLAAE